MTQFITEFYAQGENNRFDSFVQLQIHNTAVFFNHTHIKLLKKFRTKTMSTVNRKYWVTPCFISHGFGLRTFIVEQSYSINDSRHQNCVFLINLQHCFWYTFKTFWYLNKLIMKMKTVSKQQWQTSVRGYKIMCLPFYSLQIRTNQ